MLVWRRRKVLATAKQHKCQSAGISRAAAGISAVFRAVITCYASGRSRARQHFVDMMNDVTAADIQLAVREGYDSAEHLKRYTAAGFGTDQGKTGNIMRWFCWRKRAVLHQRMRDIRLIARNMCRCHSGRSPARIAASCLRRPAARRCILGICKIARF